MAKDDKPKRKPTGSYEVGYAKTPEHTRFKTGQSGNPGGGRKPIPSIDELVDAELNRTTTFKMRGEMVKLVKRDALAKRIVADAIAGNHNAQKLALALAAQAIARREGGGVGPLTDEEIDQLMVALRNPAEDDAAS